MSVPLQRDIRVVIVHPENFQHMCLLLDARVIADDPVQSTYAIADGAIIRQHDSIAPGSVIIITDETLNAIKRMVKL